MIDIDNNRYELVDGEYEYHSTPLEELQSKYIFVPLSVITDTELDIRRVAALSYLKFRCGLDTITGFTIPDMVEWCGGKPDRTANGSNTKYLSTIDSLNDRGYLTYLSDKSKSSYMKCKVHTGHCHYGWHNKFAVIYLDEIEKIMNYKKEKAKNNTFNNASILLVFAYFRSKIVRRQNKLKPEERSSEGIESRRKRLPEAYDDNISNIANEIGVHKQTLAKIIDILEYELELIVTDRAYRIRNEDNEFRTLPTIFANAYKREDKYLLVTGDNYSREEIEQKAENIKQFYQGYKIDKSKRKNR